KVAGPVLFAKRRLSEGLAKLTRGSPAHGEHAASCGELFATRSLSKGLASASCQDSSKLVFSTPNHPKIPFFML
ncbi:hypothetical protein L195_g061140, partial [Trifolium pratense]